MATAEAIEMKGALAEMTREAVDRADDALGRLRAVAGASDAAAFDRACADLNEAEVMVVTLVRIALGRPYPG